MIEKKLRLTDLYDFYGKMLTDKQNDIMDQYCNLDLSLGEISENLEISRQAVHDTIKRTEKILEKYETQLGLYERYMSRQHEFEEIESLVKRYKTSKDDTLLDAILAITRKEME